jgi:predicted nucleic acid-binding protein
VFVDTNVLVCLITKHPEPMHRAARAWFERADEQGLRAMVHPVHIAEAVFVLEGRVYGLPPRVASDELRVLLSAQVLTIQDELAVVRALERYPDTGLDFPDVLLAELARVAEKDVLSFDSDIARLGVRVVVPS